MEKPTKIEERKLQGLEWEPQVKQTALLARPIYLGQAQGEEKKHIKRGAKIGLGASLLLVSFGLAHPHALRMYFPLLSKWNWTVTRSCNTGPSVCPFKILLWWDRTEKITNSSDICIEQYLILFQQCTSNLHSHR